MPIIDLDQEVTPPTSPRTAASARREREIRMALFAKDAEDVPDLLAVQAELDAAGANYASATERFETQLILTQENLAKLTPPSTPTRNRIASPVTSPMKSKADARTVASPVASQIKPKVKITTPARSTKLASSATVHKPASKISAPSSVGSIDSTVLSSLTSSAASAASTTFTAPGFVYVPGGIYRVDQDQTFRLIDGFQEPEIAAANVQTDREKTYVVYWGHDDLHGIYGEWQGSGGATGAKEATDGLKDAIHKRFNGRQLGEDAYEECRSTGVLAALKTKLKGENFIVVKGEAPGVYTRQTVVSRGLRWHGGEICRVIGTAKDAQALFKLLQQAGYVVRGQRWQIA